MSGKLLQLFLALVSLTGNRGLSFRMRSVRASIINNGYNDHFFAKVWIVILSSGISLNLFS